MPLPSHILLFNKKISLVKYLVFIGLACLGIFIIVVSLTAKFLLEPYAKNQLEKMTRQATDGLYELKIGNLDISLWSGNITAEHMFLKMDSTQYKRLQQAGKELSDTKLNLIIPSIAFRDIQWMQFFFNKKIKVEEVSILSPQIELLTGEPISKEKKNAKKVAEDTARQNIIELLPEKISSLTSELKIDSLFIQNAKIKYKKFSSTGTTSQRAEGVYIAFSKILVDSGRVNTKKRVLFSDDVHLQIKSFEWFLPEQIYKIKLNSLEAIAEKSSLKIKGFNLMPVISDAEFVRKKRYQTDRFKVSLSTINCYNLDFEKLLKGEVKLELAQVQNVKMDVFRDKRVPKDPAHRPLTPQEAFQAVKFYFRLDTFQVDSAFIVYKELVPEAEQTGKSTFEQTSLRAYNLTNDPQLMSAKTPAIIKGKTLLMGKGLLTLHMTIPLLANNLNCTYNGSLSGMDARYFNHMLTPLEGIQIESGRIEKITYNVSVYNAVASGSLEATYNQLKIIVLNKEKAKKNKLLTFLSNLLVKSKNKNTKEDDQLKKDEIQYKKEETDGFIKFLWVSLKDGLISTLTPGQQSEGKKD